MTRTPENGPIEAARNAEGERRATFRVRCSELMERHAKGLSTQAAGDFRILRDNLSAELDAFLSATPLPGDASRWNQRAGAWAEAAETVAAERVYRAFARNVQVCGEGFDLGVDRVGATYVFASGTAREVSNRLTADAWRALLPHFLAMEALHRDGKLHVRMEELKGEIEQARQSIAAVEKLRAAEAPAHPTGEVAKAQAACRRKIVQHIREPEGRGELAARVIEIALQGFDAAAASGDPRRIESAAMQLLSYAGMVSPAAGGAQ